MAIEIKKSHKGLFTKKAKQHGMGVQEYAKYVLSNKDSQNPSTVKQANFAKNFAQFGIENLVPNNIDYSTQKNASNLGYSDTFNGVNLAAVLTTLFANKANDISGLKSENNQYIKSIQPNSIQNKNPNGLNDTPLYFKNGGGVDGKKLQDWNSFLDFVDSKGLKGSSDLDMRDKKLGQSLFDEYRKTNQNSQLSYDDVLPIQQVIKTYRDKTIADFKDGKATLGGDAGANYEHYMEGLSQPDGWFGSKTSSWKFPKEYLKTYDANNQLESTRELGLAKMKNGGKAKYGINNTPIVNAENGEVFQSNDGQIYDINGEDRHEQGGVNLQNVNRVLENTSTYRSDKNSKLLKLTPDMVSELGGLDEKPNRAMSHAQAAKFLTKKVNKQVGDYEKNLDKNTEVLKNSPNNLYANNSLQFNTLNVSNLPTEADIFDKLFEHQESIKQMNGIENGKKMKYGGNKYIIAKEGYDDDTTPYKGGKTKKGRTTPTGKDNAFDFNINDYNRMWKYRGQLDAANFPDNQSFQKSSYEYLLNRNPQAIRDMWANYGNTDFGIKNKIGEGYDFNNLTDDQLGNLKDAYADNMLGVRSLLPPADDLPVADVPNQQPQMPPIPNPTANPDINVKTPVTTTQRTTIKKDNRFNEPLRWFDIAAPLMSYLDSARIPNKYNPVNLNEVRLKQLNPEQALQRSQQDFNAVVGQLPNTGAGSSNAANVFSQKYAMDNQVIGNYDNQNAQIKNQETMYNANVRDRQSGANAQSRDVFEQKVLGSREAQRQQKLTALDDLFTRVALNHKLNREGNLMMQLFPNFDQNAQYNGTQRYFTTNSGGTGNSFDQKLRELGVDPTDLTQAQKLQYLRMQMPKKK